jgi:hypothetical protein
MIAHYNHPRGNLIVHVPNGMGAFWVKYTLRAIIAYQQCTPYGTWLEFTDNRAGLNSAAL